MFGQAWDKADATIVARDAEFTGDGSVATYSYVADVRLASGEMFRATVHEPTIATNFWAPDVGDAVSVLVRTKDRKVKFDKDDERLSVKAHHEARKRAFDDVQQLPVGTPDAAWATTDLPDVLAKRLAELGIASDGPMRVISADSPEGRAALSALTHPGVPVTQTLEARLAQLQALHERGLLTAEEYADQRHRILNEL